MYIYIILSLKKVEWMSWLQQLCEIGWQNISYIYFIVFALKISDPSQIEVELKISNEILRVYLLTKQAH